MIWKYINSTGMKNSDRRWFPRRPHTSTRREVIIAGLIGTTFLLPAPFAYSRAFGPHGGGIGAITSTRFFYVDSVSGNDANDGLSRGTAWQTIGHVNAQSYIANDSILFNAATPFSGAISLGSANWSGDPSAPLTIGSYGSGSATINSGTSVGLTLTDINGVIAIDINLEGVSQASNQSYGSYVGNSGTGQVSGIQFINVSISNYGGTGIQFEGQTTGGFANILVQSCTVNNCGNNATGMPDGPNGIHMYCAGRPVTDHTIASNNIIIQGNILTNLPGGSSGAGGGFGVFLWNCGNSSVEYNYVNNTAQNWTQNDSGPVGIIFVSCSNSVMQFNEVSNVLPSNNVDGDGLDIDVGCTNCTMQYNWAHDNYGVGLYSYCDGNGPNSNTTIRYNISQNNGHPSGASVHSEIEIWNSSGTTVSVNVYNNTVYTNTTTGSSAFALNGGGPISGNVCNNIFYTGSNGNPIVQNLNGSGAAPTFNGNCYFSAGTFSIIWNSVNYTSLSSWTGTTGQEPLGLGLTSNPQLNSPGGGGTISPPFTPASLTAYQLQSGSPMKGVGLDLMTRFSISPGSQDFYGNAIPNGGSGTGFNVGAYGGT